MEILTIIIIWWPVAITVIAILKLNYEINKRSKLRDMEWYADIKVTKDRVEHLLLDVKTQPIDEVLREYHAWLDSDNSGIVKSTEKYVVDSVNMYLKEKGFQKPTDEEIEEWAKGFVKSTYFGELTPVGWLVFAAKAALNGEIKKKEK